MTSIEYSPFILGTAYNFTEETSAKALLDFALEHGISSFDTAEHYHDGETEQLLGRLLRAYPRESFSITSKLFYGFRPIQARLSKKEFISGVDGIRKRLQIDILDTLILFRFVSDHPSDEVLDWTQELIHQQKIQSWGTSEWSADRLQEVMERCEEIDAPKPITDHTEYSLLRRRRVEEDLRGIIPVTAWLVLGCGFLTGKYQQEVPETSRYSHPDRSLSMLTPGVKTKIDSLCQLAEEVGMSAAQLSILWALRHPSVSSLIIGVSTVEQLKENVSILNCREKLSTEVYKKLNDIFSN